MKIRAFFTTAALFAAFTLTAQTQTRMTNDPVAFGMGNTGIVSDASAYSIYNNSAAAAFSENQGAMGLSYLGWSPSGTKAKIPSLSGYYRMGEKMAILVGTQYGFYPKNSYYNTHHSEMDSYHPHEFSLNLGVAYRFIDHLSGAVNIRYLNSKFHNTSASAVGIDLQVMYQAEKLSLAAALNNIGSGFDYDGYKYKQPFQIEAGVSYEVFGEESLHGLDIAAKLGYVAAPSSNRTAMAAVGLEYSFAGMFCARAGYSYSNKNKYLPPFITLGVGFNLANIHLNAGYMIGATSHSSVKNSFVIGLSYTIF